jgi:DNA-binding NtrC family response regulator
MTGTSIEPRLVAVTGGMSGEISSLTAGLWSSAFSRIGSGCCAAVLQTKKRAIIQDFQRRGGNHTGVARLLRIHPNHLHRVIRVLGLKPVLTGKS